MDDQIFADGIGAITIIGTTLRIDFVTLSPTERDASGQPKAMFRQRIIMSVEGFLRTGGKLQEAMQAVSKMTTRQPDGSQTATIETIMPASAGAPSQPARDPAGPLSTEATAKPFP
ncbi:MAG TPA: hypothetical protein VGB91_10275 [Rhizomicrobium sp.]